MTLSRRPLRSVVLAVALGLALAACSVSPTPYQAAADGQGYSEQQIENDRYRVRFAGNSATDRETVENYVLYRAAELAIQTGHDYFKVVSRDTEAVGDVYSGGPSIGVGVGGGGNFGVGLSTIVGGGGSRASYASYLDVVMYEGERPADERDAYSAWEVIETLQPEVAPGTAPPVRQG
jgi:hypothetical protein